jgi:hypothetical protein
MMLSSEFVTERSAEVTAVIKLTFLFFPSGEVFHGGHENKEPVAQVHTDHIQLNRG